MKKQERKSQKFLSKETVQKITTLLDPVVNGSDPTLEWHQRRPDLLSVDSPGLLDDKHKQSLVQEEYNRNWNYKRKTSFFIGML